MRFAWGVGAADANADNWPGLGWYSYPGWHICRTANGTAGLSSACHGGLSEAAAAVVHSAACSVTDHWLSTDEPGLSYTSHHVDRCCSIKPASKAVQGCVGELGYIRNPGNCGCSVSMTVQCPNFCRRPEATMDSTRATERVTYSRLPFLTRSQTSEFPRRLGQPID